MRIGLRKGDPVYGDEFDQWAGREDELNSAMIISHAEDVVCLRRRFVFFPWEDPGRIITRDRAKLMTAIMDSAGSFPNDIESICKLLGMKAIINAKAVPSGLLKLGLISEQEDLEGRPVLNLTELGRDMLDFYEDDPIIFQATV